MTRDEREAIRARASDEMRDFGPPSGPTFCGDVLRLADEVERLEAEHSMWADHFAGKHGVDLSHPLCHHCLSVRANNACDAVQRALAESQARERALREALTTLVEFTAERVNVVGQAHPSALAGAVVALAAPTDDTALKAALAAHVPWDSKFCSAHQRPDPMCPSCHPALREFGLRVARAIWSPHVSAEGQRQIEKAVNAVLRGER